MSRASDPPPAGQRGWLQRLQPPALRLSPRTALLALASLLLLQTAGLLLFQQRFDHPTRTLPWLLAGASLLGMALFAAGSLWATGRSRRPLLWLVGASERLGGGDFDTPVHPAGAGADIDALACAIDHTRLKLATQRQEVVALAWRDRLTGLPNRLRLRDLIQQAMSDANPPLALLMLDLDRFKHVNDVLGHDAGNCLLQCVAERLQQQVRDGDVVAHLGGDAFALLLRGADAAAASQLAQRIMLAFEQPVALDGLLVDLSAGLGIATWPAHAADADSLLKCAEVALRAAKRRTAGTQIYDPAVDSASALNLSLLSELQRAVVGGELRLLLQPKIDIRSGAVCGAEALLRWQHPSRGLLLPLQFIPLAEQTGFIRQLTLWVFEQAAAEQVALALLGVRHVAVNLSSRDLLDLGLPDKLDTILRRHRAVAQGFCLEITERTIMDDPQRAEAALNRLAERGYKLAIDDFGTGYSSLIDLKRLPLDELKIDRRFVMAMEHDLGDARIVRSAIGLAHNLGLSVVAEGIESDAALTLLQQLRCDEGQGFHMSPPLPPADFCDWVARWQVRPPVALGSPSGLRTSASASASLLH